MLYELCHRGVIGTPPWASHSRGSAEMASHSRGSAERDTRKSAPFDPARYGLPARGSACIRSCEIVGKAD